MGDIAQASIAYGVCPFPNPPLQTCDRVCGPYVSPTYVSETEERCGNREMAELWRLCFACVSPCTTSPRLVGLTRRVQTRPWEEQATCPRRAAGGTIACVAELGRRKATQQTCFFFAPGDLSLRTEVV